jgi:hypothetical protein
LFFHFSLSVIFPNISSEELPPGIPITISSIHTLKLLKLFNFIKQTNQKLETHPSEFYLMVYGAVARVIFNHEMKGKHPTPHLISPQNSPAVPDSLTLLPLN